MNPGSRPGRTTVVVALVVFALSVWAFHVWWTIARTDRAWFSFDSAEYALAARNLAATGRLTTPFSYVGVLRDGWTPPYPLLAGHPLLPLLQAPLFALLGAVPWVSLAPAVIAHLVTVVLASRLVLACGGGLAVSVGVGVALAGAPAMLENASDGLSEMPFTALWTAAFLLLAGFRHAPRAGALGVVLGLAHLARPVAAPTMPLWLAAAAWASAPGTRLRSAARVALAFAPFPLALLLYKGIAAGDPFADVSGILLLAELRPEMEFGEHDVGRLLHPPDGFAWVRGHPAEFAAKLARNLPEMARHSLTLGGWLIGVAFAWWVLRGARDGREPLRLAAGGSLACIALLAAVTLARPLFLFPMLPTVTALGALSLERLLHAARLPGRVALVGVAAALAWSSWRPLAYTWRAHRDPAQGLAVLREREIAGLGAMLSHRLPPGALVVSDMAPWVSWYTGHPSVNLPLRTGDLAELRERHRVGAVVITSEWLVQRPGNEAWRDVLDSGAPLPGWVAASVLHSGRLRACVLLPEPPADGLRPGRSPASPAH